MGAGHRHSVGGGARWEEKCLVGRTPHGRRNGPTSRLALKYPVGHSCGLKKQNKTKQNLRVIILSWEFNSAFHKSSVCFSHDFIICGTFPECYCCMSWGKNWPWKVHNFNKNNLENNWIWVTDTGYQYLFVTVVFMETAYRCKHLPSSLYFLIY